MRSSGSASIPPRSPTRTTGAAGSADCTIRNVRSTIVSPSLEPQCPEGADEREESPRGSAALPWVATRSPLVLPMRVDPPPMKIPTRSVISAPQSVRLALGRLSSARSCSPEPSQQNHFDQIPGGKLTHLFGHHHEREIGRASV